MSEQKILLSICIATRNRAEVIGPTLDALLEQCTKEVEVVVVDGASTDNTAVVVGSRAVANPALRYIPQASNSGVDGDFDKAVELAAGEYCWLLSDDDFPTEGALLRILAECRRGPAVIVADAEVYSEDFSVLLKPRRLPFVDDRRYRADEQSALLADCGDALTFIGALIVRRAVWLERDRRSYYGTEFVHVGVVFQSPLPGEALALAGPVVRIRYGVGNWAKRSFEVWMFKWPKLIWSFAHLAASARQKVTPEHPWKSTALLLLFRAKGWFDRPGYCRLLAPLPRPRTEKIIPALISWTPGILAFVLVWSAMRISGERYSGSLRDLKISPYHPGSWIK